MKKNRMILWIVCSGLLFAMAAGCGKNVQPDSGTLPPTETVTMTATVAPTETPVPTEVPTVEPTKAPQETLIPVPTEEPHVHTWTEKETAPTCTEDGITWKECECGEVSEETTLPATGHGETTYKVVTEATTEAEGQYEVTCNICSTIIETGLVPKLTPTPTPTEVPKATATPKPTKAPDPTATPTPKATATPKPTKAPEPTRIPVESYTWWDVNHELIRYKDESKTEVVKTYYDLNLVSDKIPLYNFSDLKGEPQAVIVRDYPSHDAKQVFVMKMEERDLDNNDPYKHYTRGQVKAIARCVETGWYKVTYDKDKNGNDVIGYVDDEYVKANALTGFTADGHHCPMYEYCQFEMPSLGPRSELKEIDDLTLQVGREGYRGTSHMSKNLYYALYSPSLDMNLKCTIGVFTVENPSIAEFIDKTDCRIYYKSGLGHYGISRGTGYGTYFIGKSVGTTNVTLTEYQIYEYQENDGNPTFKLGEVINTLTFTITVTE